MASISNPSRVEELAPSTSTSTSAESSMPAFLRYLPPTTKLAFQSDKRYHVFLSFRGPDVRQALVDHLFEALSAAGLNVFLDSERLEKGEIIDYLFDEIKSSAIRIPIFSKGYADSVWCLKEAAAMLSTPALIIPLFYHVDPTHVRYPVNDSSPYKQSFLKHYGHSDRYTREEIDGWKDALLQICSRSGWSMDVTQGFEARLVKTVVNDLIKTLDRVPLEVANHPVGMDGVKNALIRNLNLNSAEEVVKVGIWGIGGIGKTTVAKAVYNQVYADFNAASFVFNVRATAETRGLTNLQKAVLKDVSKYEGEVDSVSKGISLFRDRLGGKRVLLIFDDVDAVEQLNALVGDWLAPGSRVIITSRDRHIFNVAGVSYENVHEMSGLKINEGLQLFSWHAFLRASPSISHEDLSKGIVEGCKGHPLSLEVIGSFLYDKQDDTACWIEALSNITLIPDVQKRVYNTLKISYSALSDEEKEIFVDIACFFIGEDKTLPILFWKSLYKIPETAVCDLAMKSLIKIDDKGVFDMHDHLRDLGRTIAQDEKQGTRLWEASNLSTLSSINFSRLYVNGGNPQRLIMLYRPGLRYLHLQNVHIEGMTEDTLAMLPPTLIWLRLEHCTFAIGKNRAVPKMLTAIRKMNRTLREPRQSRFDGNIIQLKIMQLKHSNSLSPPVSLLNNLSQLQHLDLGRCIRLNKLPNTIGNQSQLQHLILRGCGTLKELPDTIGNLLQLQQLDLGRCGRLNHLPDTIGNLSQLQHLDLEWCERLNELPDTIGNLLQLQHLDLGCCVRLNNLPDTVGNLSQLQHLDLRGCGRLNKLPDTIGNLSELQRLDLGGCEGLNNLPDTIGTLSELQHLDLGGCERLNNIPETIGNLSQLRRLDIGNCRRLRELPDSIGNLSELQRLDLGGSGRLDKLPDTIGNLSQLQHLDLRGCGGLNDLPNTIGNLSQLQHLDLGWCGRLNDLPDTIGNLLQLRHLDLGWCGELNTLPDTIGNLSQLQHLELGWCGSLNKLPDTMGDLSQLQHLHLGGCGRLDSLPDTLGNLSQLKHDLRWCKRLNFFPNTITNPSQLQYLCSIGGRMLKNLPATIGNLPQLGWLPRQKSRHS